MLCVLAVACIISMVLSLKMSLSQGRLLAVMRHSIVMSVQLFYGRDPRVLSEVRSADGAKQQIPFAVSLVVATLGVVLVAAGGR
jgi:hypothetical protein